MKNAVYTGTRNMYKDMLVSTKSLLMQAIDMAMLAEEKDVSVDFVSALCQIFKEGFGFSWERTMEAVRRCLK